MLLRFGVKNFRSIREYQNISFVASNSSLSSDRILHAKGLDISVLPACVIYGANASGKSNLLRAIQHMSNVVQFRPPPTGRKRPIAVDQFANGNPRAITHYDCDIVLNGRRYHYGFEFTRERFLSEWLFEFTPKTQFLLRRKISPAGRNTQSLFSRTIPATLRRLIENCPDNRLFVSFAAEQEPSIFKDIHGFFANRLAFHLDHGSGVDQRSLFREPTLAKACAKFLGTYDVGVRDIVIATKKSDPKAAALRKKITQAIGDWLDDIDVGEEFDREFLETDDSKRVLFLHGDADHKSTFSLDINEESRGTRRLMELFFPITKALIQGNFLVVDEFDSSLHPVVSKKLIEAFFPSKGNVHNAQIVLSTHDTNLLSSDLLLSDQIWFCEKDRDGASHFYPLSDFELQKSDNFEKGYLEGRFGAIPFMGSSNLLREILSVAHEKKQK